MVDMGASLREVGAEMVEVLEEEEPTVSRALIRPRTTVQRQAISTAVEVLASEAEDQEETKVVVSARKEPSSRTLWTLPASCNVPSATSLI